MASTGKILLLSEDPETCNKWKQDLAQSFAVHIVNHSDDYESQCETHQPEIILYNLDGIDAALNSAALLQKVIVLRERFTEIKFVAFSNQPDDDLVMDLMHAGIHGFSSKDISAEVIQKIVTSVLSDEIWISRKLMQRLIMELASNAQFGIQSLNTSSLDQLTAREREIALLVAKGENNKKIASMLNIAERTVKAHMSSIFQKTGMNDRLQLALLVHNYLQVTEK